MKRIKSWSTLVLMMTAFSVHGQTTPKELIDEFFEFYSKSPGMAIDKALSFSTCSQKTKEQVDSLKSRAKNFQDMYGSYIGHQQIDKKFDGFSFSTVTFLVKYDVNQLE
ncbi:hypothetical protein JYT72_01965 [Crocinitomix catalasitica]|nr:hypothetical protein [Crocinitomix catalasitica]